jgi:hypothetical protein
MSYGEPIKSGWVWVQLENGPLAFARAIAGNRARYILADGSVLRRERVFRCGPIEDPLPGKILAPPDLPADHPLWERIESKAKTGATFVFQPDDLFQVQQLIKAPFQNGSAILAGLRGASATYEEINLGALAFMELHVTSAAGTVSFGVGQPEYWYALRSFDLAEWAHVQANGGRLVPMVRTRPEASSDASAFAILQEVAETELAKYGVPPKRDALLAMVAPRTGRGTKQLRPLYQRLPKHLRLASRDPNRG